MAISSINIQASSSNSFAHNARETKVTYLIDNSKKNECDKTANEANILYENLKFEALQNYTNRTGQKVQTKEERFRWSAVVNLNAHHTLKDVKKLSEKLSKKYGWQNLQIAVHKDEGHLEDNKKVYNYHAHLEFFMLDKKGIYKFKKRDFSKAKMRELQTLVSTELNMERGKDVRETKTRRLEHRDFKEVAQLKDKVSESTGYYIQMASNFRNKSDSQEKEIEELKSELKLKEQEIKELKSNSNTKDLSKTSQNELEIEKLRNEIKELNYQYKSDREQLKNSGEAKQKDYQELKKSKEEIEQELKGEIEELAKENFYLKEDGMVKDYHLSKSEEENKELKEKNKSLRDDLKNLNELMNDDFSIDDLKLNDLKLNDPNLSTWNKNQ